MNDNQNHIPDPGYLPPPGYNPPPPPPPSSDSNATTSMIMGLIALISNFVGLGVLVPLILGPLAMHFSKKSVEALGLECSSAKTGRICGLIGLILGIVQIVAVVALLVLYIAFILIGVILSTM